ncbi:GNAT family N-acetyltransferase [Priestia abyssalis]|uniref:GNAT family N-acetyltransferase n=1 Tax=Priestia abyssalis TaxID=1221450 RepID=UPI00099527ED|nr:GNAT family N-acetyltransferase [Priestia abyssalis]
MTKSVEKYDFSNIIEENLMKHWMYLKQTEGSVYVDEADFKYIAARPYNRVLYADWLNRGIKDQKVEINRLLEQYDREGDPLMWIIGPSTKPSDINRTLTAMGLEHHQNWTGMAMSLTDGLCKPSDRDDFQFNQVTNAKDLNKWVDVYIDGYEKPASGKEAIFKRFEQIIKKMPDEYKLYLGFYKGEPAVVGTLFLDGDIAGLYCIATAPDMRRKGLAAAYLQNLLDEACAQGASHCILHATEAGKPTYEKLGFQSYSKFQVYLYKDDHSER